MTKIKNFEKKIKILKIFSGGKISILQLSTKPAKLDQVVIIYNKAIYVLNSKEAHDALYKIKFYLTKKEKENLEILLLQIKQET